MLQIMKTMWDGFISQLFSAWGNVRSMREVYKRLYVIDIYTWLDIGEESETRMCF